jgi:maltose alpha-D-glucosyltransferase/alpha-amylase
VLYTGKDFVILDFEGEPLRPLRERRMKYCPLRDVAGMLRSFHYAVYAAILDRAGDAPPSGTRPKELDALERWGQFWHAWVSIAFLRSYLAETREAGLLPDTHDELKLLCDALLLEKAVYELAYELGHRPTWVRIPLQGILQLLA